MQIYNRRNTHDHYLDPPGLEEKTSGNSSLPGSERGI